MKKEDLEDKEIEKEEIEETKSKDNKIKKDKVLFIQRFAAFIIDVVIVSLISSLIAIPFVDNEKISKINDRATELSQQMVDNKISMEEYTYQYIDVTYDLARVNGITNIIAITVGLLYFVVLQIYRNGQTIGKKLLKIKVISDDGDLTMNQMIFRALIANSLLVDFLSLVFVIFTDKNAYFYCVGLFTLFQYTITLISIFMVMYSKDGRAIHDRLVHTRVVREK